MPTKVDFKNRSLIWFNKCAVTGAFSLLLLLPLAARGGGVVTNCTEANLRAALSGGGLVTFACDGTITLASTITNDVETTLDGTGHQVTLSGGDAVRVFCVSTNVGFTLVNLTIANGRDTSGMGGGIFNDGGNVTLLGVMMQNNLAISLRGHGGAVCNRGGTLNTTNSIFVSNLAQSVTDIAMGDAAGGAVFATSGYVNLEGCVFTGNAAAAALDTLPYDPGHLINPPLVGSNGLGGAICNLGGTLRANACTFRLNSATGGKGGYGMNGSIFPGPGGIQGGSGGQGDGGAIFNTGLATVNACLFLENRVRGGNGGKGGDGGPGGSGGTPGGYGGPGGNGLGAALGNAAGVFRLVNCTVISNVCVGGDGGYGGRGGDAYSGASGRGGNGGPGGSAFGAVYSTNQLALTNCTVAFNSANFGTGGPGGAPGSTTYGVLGLPGSPGANGLALGGGLSGNGTAMINTMLATNAPGGNWSGTNADLAHNLSSDGSCIFTNVGSLNNTDPKLGPLANNGGPTLTMALLPGSPAIDAGDTGASPPTDQRGVPRPVGVAADIGAYEFTAVLEISRTLAGGINLLVAGSSGQSCRLLTSTNLADWQCVATNQIGPDGTVLLQDNGGTGEARCFYKVALP